METSVSKITEKRATRRSHRLLAPIAQLPDSQEPVLRTIFSEETGKEQIIKIRPENIGVNELNLTKVRFPKMMTMSFLRELADSFKYSVNNVESRVKSLKKRYTWLDTEEEKEWFYKSSSDYPTSQMLPGASTSEILRVDHYRQMFPWEKRQVYTSARKAEYILDFKRKSKTDLYKVKWCGLPEYAATWVRPVDVLAFRSEFARKVTEFWEAAAETVPHKDMPIVRRSNCSIPDEYVAKICSKYQKEKRESMEFIREENPLASALLIENEYDVCGSPFNFEFIAENQFVGTPEQLAAYEEEKSTQAQVAEAMGYFCKEECGECSANLYKEYALASHKATYSKYKHYKYDEERSYRKVCHPAHFLIFECTDDCKCKREGKCKLDMLAKLRASHSSNKFLVSRTGDDRGWGLTAMQAFKQGEPVIEYVGEVMTEETFRQNETEIWRKNLMFSMDLTQNDKSLPAYTVDSSRKGNHSRLINHSCEPNLETYKIIKEDRNINRPHPVLFAARDIAIGEELSFNYKLTIINQNENSKQDDNSDSENEFDVVENGRAFICRCGSKKCIDRKINLKRKLNSKSDQKISKAKKPKIG